MITRTAIALALGLAAVPANAQIQCLSNCTSVWTSTSSLSTCCGSETDFTTTHKWTRSSDHTLVLDSTAFVIKFNPVAVDFSLWWKDHEIEKSTSVWELESKGATRARHMQELGVPLQ